MMFNVVPGKFQTTMIDTTLQPELSVRTHDLVFIPIAEDYIHSKRHHLSDLKNNLLITN
jgi:hypothetical protein